MVTRDVDFALLVGGGERPFARAEVDVFVTGRPVIDGRVYVPVSKPVMVGDRRALEVLPDGYAYTAVERFYGYGDVLVYKFSWQFTVPPGEGVVLYSELPSVTSPPVVPGTGPAFEQLAQGYAEAAADQVSLAEGVRDEVQTIRDGIRGDLTDVDSQTATAILDPESETSAALEKQFLTTEAAQETFTPLQSVVTARRIRTTKNGVAVMAEQPPIAFSPVDPSGATQITVSPDKTYQEVTGVGAAVTDASAWLFLLKLSRRDREAVLRDLFGPESGAFRWIRVALGNSDFSAAAQRSNDETFPATLSAATAVGDSAITSFTKWAAGDSLVIDAAPATNLIAAAPFGATSIDIGRQFFVGETFTLQQDERTVTGSVAITGGFRISFAGGLTRAYGVGSSCVGTGTQRQEIATVAAASTGTTGPYTTTLTAPLTKAHAASIRIYKRDPTLAEFSFNHEYSYVVPILQEILKINPGIRILGSVWLPPSWMKNTLTSGFGTARDEELPTLAAYTVRLVTSFRDAGIPITVLSPQNEPDSPPTSLTYYTPERMVGYLKLIRAELDAQGLFETKIMAGEGQWNGRDYPETLMADPSAVKVVDMIGFHNYSGVSTDVLPVSRMVPKPILMTERRTLLSEGWYASSLIMVADCVIGVFRGGGEASILWNIALDEAGNPTQGSTGRRGVITIPSNGSGQVGHFIDYYALKHFSKYVRPGASRIDSTTLGTVGRYGTDVQTVAFRNLDNSVVLLAFNSHPSDPKTIQVVDGRVSAAFTVTLESGEVSTFVWSESPDIVAPEPIPPVAPGPALAQPTVVGTPTSAKDSTNAASGFSFTHTVPATGSNRAVAVIVSGSWGPEGYTWPHWVNYGGVPMRLGAYSAQSNSASHLAWTAIYYLVDPPTGAQTVTIGNSGRGIINAVAVGLAGVDPADPVSIGSNTGGTSTGEATITNPDGPTTDLIIAAMAARTISAITPAAGQTVVQHSEASTAWMTVTRQNGGTTQPSSYTFIPQTPPDVYAISTLAFHGVAS